MKKVYGEIEGRTRDMNLYYYSFIPENAKAVVLVIHGMMEHSGRYALHRQRLLELGIGYAAVDLPGHGRNVENTEQPGGWINSGFEAVIDEIGTFIKGIKEAYGLPVILFGHSLGSFISLGTISSYGEQLMACILSGTNDKQSPLLVKTGLVIANLIIKLKGVNHRSPLLYNLIFGSYNKRIKPLNTKYDWLTKRKKVINEYIDDPLCGFLCSTLLYKDMAEWISHLYDDRSLSNIPSELPVYILAGGNDPVGNYGKGPLSLSKRLKDRGLKEVILNIYEGNRHECLNETNSDEVFTDIMNFCLETIGGGS